MQQFLTDFVDPANIAGHISYMLLIGSMLMRKMLYLRLMAVAAGTFSGAYYFSLNDSISLFWEVLFTLVNATQLVILFVENRRGRFTAEEQAFIDAVLPTVERAQTRRLMKLGAWTEISDSNILIHEETTPPSLFYVVNGTARVERSGRTLGMVGPGDFLGEMSYLTGKQATATVTSVTPMRYLAFDRTALREYLEKNPDVRHSLESGFNRNLVDKLVKTNTEVQEQKVETPKPRRSRKRKTA
jgi:CRP-like cAMP-binding protein